MWKVSRSSLVAVYAMMENTKTVKLYSVTNKIKMTDAY